MPGLLHWPPITGILVNKLSSYYDQGDLAEESFRIGHFLVSNPSLSLMYQFQIIIMFLKAHHKLAPDNYPCILHLTSVSDPS